MPDGLVHAAEYGFDRITGEGDLDDMRVGDGRSIGVDADRLGNERGAVAHNGATPPATYDKGLYRM